MLVSVIDQLSGLVGNRFKLNAFFPALVASFLGTGLVLISTVGVDAGVDEWKSHSGLVQGALGVLAVAGIYAVAAFLDSQSLAIVRAYEGYAGPLKWWGSSAQAWHRARRDRVKQERPETFRSEYTSTAPAADNDLLPTRIGNVMRSGELYATERYGCDAMVVWPRLLPHVPDAEATMLGQSRSSMEQLLILSLILSVFGFAGGIVFAFQPDSSLWSLGALVGGWALAGLLYRGAVEHAMAYSLQLKAIFDAHRLEVFSALQVSLPRNRSEERRRWADITSLLAQNHPDVGWPYASAAPVKE